MLTAVLHDPLQKTLRALFIW